jgi:hypothetical protein
VANKPLQLPDPACHACGSRQGRAGPQLTGVPLCQGKNGDGGFPSGSASPGSDNAEVKSTP